MERKSSRLLKMSHDIIEEPEIPFEPIDLDESEEEYDDSEDEGVYFEED